MNTDSNKLIAEFLGYTQPHPDYPTTTYWYKEGEAPLTNLLFNTDWNWLMVVVEKIETLKIKEVYGEHNEKEIEAEISISIEGDFCQILSNGLYLNEVSSIKSSSKIESDYLAIIEFINW